MLNEDPRIAAEILTGLLKVMSKCLRTTTDKKLEEVKF